MDIKPESLANTETASSFFLYGLRICTTLLLAAVNMQCFRSVRLDTEAVFIWCPENNSFVLCVGNICGKARLRNYFLRYCVVIIGKIIKHCKVTL